ncbi:unnamed protein product [Eruca vesicaria subsp. sativa]|uniref:KIB1-4 beta-propeller domain-containing protein n=1 Tax=Eruca vesicaria subsp. sativa TaxID=29727 RepID=A0ABC8M582_ERUVS|nr:unnamed protein product [Eruca vesicaria subsp. sativa]
MSQLLVRMAKLSSSSSSQRLCSRELRRFSTTATTTPYLLFKQNNYRRVGSETVVDLNLYDPSKDERVKIHDLTFLEELTASSMRIGSSRGWVCVKNSDDSTVRITNIFNPCAPFSSHNVISLPPLDDTRVRVVSSMALSASPEQQDCVVAFKSRKLVSLCRPGDSVWTHIEVPFVASSEIMYSTKDCKFYLNRRESDEEGPIDLINNSSSSLDKFPQVSLYQRFPNSDIPKSIKDQVTSTIMSQYVVESPSCDSSFIVYWCNEYLNQKEKWESTRQKGPPYKPSHFRTNPKGFVVFRQDAEQRMGSYTEDIGDLCIFLSRGVAFCVSATQYPGLKPNSIYYASFQTGFGFYDLSSNTLHEVIDEDPLSSFYQWLAPLSNE